MTETFNPTFLDKDYAAVVYDRLWNELEWERRPDAPRREYWTNTLERPYTYGRGAGVRTYYPKTSHPIIDEVTNLLEDALGFRYEGCFLNGYEGKKDWLGWHADDDPGIDHAYPIAIVTVGGARDIQFMPIGGDKSTVETIRVTPGSLLLMPAGMQSTHYHRIPKAGWEAAPRISLTYRKLVG